jgi:hypothetical protein
MARVMNVASYSGISPSIEDDNLGAFAHERQVFEHDFI